MENSSLCCTVVIEELSATGNIVTKTQHRNLTLTLGRDEFREMQLKVSFLPVFSWCFWESMFFIASGAILNSLI